MPTAVPAQRAWLGHAGLKRKAANRRIAEAAQLRAEADELEARYKAWVAAQQADPNIEKVTR